MKLGPLTFQWACFACVIRSTASASRTCRSSVAALRVFEGMSVFVLCISPSSNQKSKREQPAVARPRISIGKNVIQDNLMRLPAESIAVAERRLLSPHPGRRSLAPDADPFGKCQGSVDDIGR